MEDIKKLLTFGSVPVDYETLLSVYSSYASPKDKIDALAKNGYLVRLKRGLYLVSPAITNEQISRGVIANHLCGPSYVSLQTALSYYAMIPEQVFSTQSVTVKKARAFKTPYGRFEYLKVPASYYSVGITLPTDISQGSYYLATPEKALCDLLYFTRGIRIQSKKAMREFLFEDMRIDLSSLSSFDEKIVKELIVLGKKSRAFELLLEVAQSELSS